LRRQRATCALLDTMGWEDVQQPKPVMIYLDVHRQALLDATRSELANQTARTQNPSTPNQEREEAQTSRALLEQLIATIESKP
jgi:hypothetical protein